MPFSPHHDDTSGLRKERHPRLRALYAAVAVLAAAAGLLVVFRARQHAAPPVRTSGAALPSHRTSRAARSAPVQRRSPAPLRRRPVTEPPPSAGYTIAALDTVALDGSNGGDAAGDTAQNPLQILDMNERGEVIGIYASGVGSGGGSTRAIPFLYRPGRGTIRLPGLPGVARMVATSINERGQIVGYADRGARSLLVVWPPGGTGPPRPLPLPAGMRLVTPGPVQINDRGQILFNGAFDPGSAVGYLWTGDRAQPFRRFTAFAKVMNNRGLVVGGRDTREVSVWAAEDGAAVRPLLPRLDDPETGRVDTTTKIAYDVNDRGDILVGLFHSPEPDISPTEILLLWEGETMVPLGTTKLGNTSFHGCRLNNRGQIVISGQHEGTLRAFFVGSGTDRLYDLNSVLPADSEWYLQSADAINDRGQIAGVGVFRGRPRAFLLTPLEQGPAAFRKKKRSTPAVR